jgi:hypothetical protein
MTHDDADLVRAVAEDYVTLLGRNAVTRLRDEEAISRSEGDGFSAEDWRDIADAAALLLRRLQ